MPAPVALTGVPGTGKSTTAARLATRFRTLEVAELATDWGFARRAGDGVTVDLEGMRYRFRHRPPEADLVVGHLAHLLPMRDVIVLRCHPEVLVDRLKRAGRGSEQDRRTNYVAEAVDVVLGEALGPRRRVWEVDTTHRSPDGVARVVSQLWRRRPPQRVGTVNWLADPAVTEHLLEWAE